MRRLFLALAIFCLAFLIFSKWREGRSGYGLLDLLKGQRPPAETVTLATGPKLELGDLQVLEKLNEESSKLAAAVLPLSLIHI